jgi:hypothetical protein
MDRVEAFVPRLPVDPDQMDHRVAAVEGAQQAGRAQQVSRGGGEAGQPPEVADAPGDHVHGAPRLEEGPHEVQSHESRCPGHGNPHAMLLQVLETPFDLPPSAAAQTPGSCCASRS